MNKVLFHNHQQNHNQNIHLHNGSSKENVPNNASGAGENHQLDQSQDCSEVVDDGSGNFSEPEDRKGRSHLIHNNGPQAPPGEPIIRIKRRQALGQSPDRLSESSDSDSLRIGLKSVASTPLRDR